MRDRRRARDAPRASIAAVVRQSRADSEHGEEGQAVQIDPCAIRKVVHPVIKLPGMQNHVPTVEPQKSAQEVARIQGAIELFPQ